MFSMLFTRTICGICSLLCLAGIKAVVFKSSERPTIVYNNAEFIDGNLIDEDGNVFVGDWNISNGLYKVGYDTKGTVSRLDDEPVIFIPVNERL